MSNSTTVAAIQSSFGPEREDNRKHMHELVRQAQEVGAQIIVMPELFEGPYFPQNQREEDFARARSLNDNELIESFQALAAELEVVLPVSFFERDGQSLFNSVAMIDADGSLMGVYRKSHIPDGPGYQEKFFFRPGDTGFKVWNTRHGAVGVGICWDQWFPEAARAMVLAGADILLYPTAIGSEPDAPELDTQLPWQRVMQGHAVANACGVVAANRVGVEDQITFYGSSFICDQRGDLLEVMGRTQQGFITARFDLDEMRRYRDSFGFFRDRRPDLYKGLV